MKICLMWLLQYGPVRSHIFKALIHEAKVLHEIIVTSITTKSVWEGLIKMLNPQTIEASSSHPVVEKKFCIWIRHNICLVLQRNIVMTWMKSPQIMIIMLILCDFPYCFIVWLHLSLFIVFLLWVLLTLTLFRKIGGEIGTLMIMHSWFWFMQIHKYYCFCLSAMFCVL